MAGIIVADTIQSGGSFIRLNSASQTVATINAAGIYANTGNLLIAANGTIGVASITNTAITGTMTQAQIGSGIAGTGPAFSVVKGGSTQSITSNIYTKVTYQTTEFDTNSCWSAANNRFTPNVAGYYQFNWSGSVETTAANAGYNFVLYKNDSALISMQYQWASSTGGNGAGMQGNALVYANGTTDYFEIFALTNNGNALNSGINNRFSGCLVRAA